MTTPVYIFIFMLLSWGHDTESSTVPTEVRACDDGWLHLGGKCYRLFYDYLNWNESETACNSIGANLASITSRREQQFIDGLMDGMPDNVWVGAQKKNGHWSWTDGSHWFEDIHVWNSTVAQSEDFLYIGCYVDTEVRDLDGLMHMFGRCMTREVCIKRCKNEGYAYAGLQAEFWCLCGNNYGRYGPASSGECNRTCAGNRSQTCGGSWRNDVYNILNPDQPENYEGFEDCGEFRTSCDGGELYDQHCEATTQPFICMKTVSEFQTCPDYLVTGPLGVQDDQLTASSVWNQYSTNFFFGPERARLNTEYTHEAGSTYSNGGGWYPGLQDLMPYIQVLLNSESVIHGVVTQGCNLSEWDIFQWVTKYRVQYSVDCVNFVTVDDGKGNETIFSGNIDSNTVLARLLDNPVIAKCVRIHPTESYNGTCMRFDLIGCPADSDSMSCSYFLVSGPKGVDDHQLTASSVLGQFAGNFDHGPRWGRLFTKETDTNAGGWVGDPSVLNNYIQVILNSVSIVYGVVTQGRMYPLGNQRVTSYTVQYSMDCVKFDTVKNDSGNDMIFNGSYGVGSVVTNMLEIPIIAKCVRVHPVTWSEHIAMRFDLLGCPLDMVSSTPFPTETVCSSNAITDSNNVTDSNIVTQDPTTDAPSANTSNSSQTLNIPTRVQVHSPTLTNTSSEPSTTVDNAATTNAHASVTASIVAPNLSAPNDSVSLTDPSESSVKFTEPPVTQTGDTVKHSVAQTGTPATSLSTMHVTTDKPETTIPVPHSAATTESNEEATEHTTIGTTAYIRASTVSSAAQTDASIVETTTTTTAAAAAAAEAAAAAAGQIIDSSNPTGDDLKLILPLVFGGLSVIILTATVVVACVLMKPNQTAVKPV